MQISANIVTHTKTVSDGLPEDGARRVTHEYEEYLD